MDAKTIELIIKWGPLALVVIVFLWCFILGAIRGTYKVLRRMIYVILYVVLIWLFIGPITNLILDLNITINGYQGVRNYLVHLIESNETINNFLSYSQNLKGIVVESPEIILSPILFIVLVVIVLPISYPIYWIYLIIYNLIAKLVFKRCKYEVDENGNVLRNEKGKKVKVQRRKGRLLGGVLRGVQGVFLICVVLLPVNFINRIYNKAKNVAHLKNDETLCDINSSLKEYNDICGYLDIYNETIFAKLGGEKSLDKIVSDRLTTVKYNDMEINLENELSSIAVSAVLLNDSGVMDLFVDGKFNLETADFSKVDFDKLSNLVDYLFSSSLVSELTQTGVKYILNEVVNDDLVKLLKDDDIVSKLEYENANEIKQELKDVISILKFAVEKNIDDAVISNKNNVVQIVNNVNEEDVETLLNKILSLRILNKAMPSIIEAYGEKYGVEVPESMTTELNVEVSVLLSAAIKLVKTMEISKMEDIREGNLVDNLTKALFENGALKVNSKESLASLLNDLNSSYLFKNVISEQANKLLDKKDYKIDARVLRYVDSKEAWLKELSVLDKAYLLYDGYKVKKEIDYVNVTGLLNEISQTKVVLSVLPFAYDELLPKVGIEIEGDLPVIDFDGENENTSKEEFYALWEGELSVLKNIADEAGKLELQSLEGINLDLLKDDEKVMSLASIMGNVYSSDLLREPVVNYMKDVMNEILVDYNVEFSKDELLVINTKEKWSNELSNISKVFQIDFSKEENINASNINTIFTSIGRMQLFDRKKIEILKYAVKESKFLNDDEFNSISWPSDDATSSEFNNFWNNETGVLVKIVDKKESIKNLANVSLETLDTNEFGGLLNEVMKSSILKPIVVKKISDLLVSNDIKSDLDSGSDASNLKYNIANVGDWTKELSSIKELAASIDDVVTTTYVEIKNENRYTRSGEISNYIYTQNNAGDYLLVDEKYYLIENDYRYNKVTSDYEQNDEGSYLKVSTTLVEEVFDTIEDSALLQNSRAHLLLEAVKTINITEVPESVTVSKLMENNYALYNSERDIIIKVSSNKNAFDNVSNMKLSSINTEEIGELLDGVTSSVIFESYVVNQIASVFTKNGINDDSGIENNMKSNIANVNDVSSWKIELTTIKDMLTMTSDTFDDVDEKGKTKVDIMFENIEKSLLLKNSRANILIKAINTVNISGVSVPNNVDSMVLSADSYAQYNKETALLKSFAHNVKAIDGLGGNISSINDKVKEVMADLLNDMKLSKIFKTKYVATVKSVLDNIDKAIVDSNYDDLGVVVNRSDEVNDYVNIDWGKEINILSTISANIVEVSKYNIDNISEDKDLKIIVIGSTLDAIESSSFFGASNCQLIANSVIKAITGNMVQFIDKPVDKTWTDVFNAAI